MRCSNFRAATPIKHAVFVEVHESVEETEWLLQVADKHQFIKGGFRFFTPVKLNMLHWHQRYLKYILFHSKIHTVNWSQLTL